MSDTKPGADELRMRAILRKQGVGPDAEPAYDWWRPKQDPPTADTEPTYTESDEDEEPDDEDEPSKPAAFAPQPGYYPQPHMPAFIGQAHRRADAALSPRTRKLLYNASAAGTGWVLGLYQQFAHAIADCGHQTGTSGALTLGIGGSLLIAHIWDRRTRHWWPPLAWCARIPLATAVLALLLWAPGS